MRQRAAWHSDAPKLEEAGNVVPIGVDCDTRAPRAVHFGEKSTLHRG
jgi:hypothetical protein